MGSLEDKGLHMSICNVGILLEQKVECLAVCMLLQDIRRMETFQKECDLLSIPSDQAISIKVYSVPKEIDFLRSNMKCSGENVILRGIFHVVSCFPLHFMLYPGNLHYFSISVYYSVWRILLYVTDDATASSM